MNIFDLFDLAYMVGINGKLAAVRCWTNEPSLSDEISTQDQ